MAHISEASTKGQGSAQDNLRIFLEKLPGYRPNKLAYCIGGLTPLVESSIITLEQALQVATTRLARIERLTSRTIDNRSAHEDPRVVGIKAAEEFMQRRLPRIELVPDYLLQRRARKNA